MPPKFNSNDPEIIKLVDLFQTIGFTKAKATETTKSPKVATLLKDIIERNTLSEKKVDEKKGSLFSGLAVQGSALTDEQRTFIVEAILDGRLKSPDQLSAAVKYVEKNGIPDDQAGFDSECGVGFTISPEDLYSKVLGYIKGAIPSGWSDLGRTIGDLKLRSDIRWASPLEVKNATEKAFTEVFGVKAPASKSKAPVKSEFDEGFLGSLHKPGENPQIHPHLREAHLKATGGAVWTRFPPEPNGYLHIGHAKAIYVDFGYADHHGGKTYLRYDDTNPEAEEGRYFESILETVRWLGYEPWKITYSSDYFQELYDLAVDLIKRDKAYVCYCTADEIKAGRGVVDGKEGGPRYACSHRSRPISESLAEFEKMRDGTYGEGDAILRMKQNFEDDNPQMWDLIAYRVVTHPHHRTGDKWRIYPTYDYTHCLVDSFENISHSLCTTEFILHRPSYEWLCDALEVYKPRQSEFGRLSITGTITSKRKIKALVEEGHVRSWNDPRLFTLIALRRRGVPPGAIKAFVKSLGVSTAVTTIQAIRFDSAVRSYLEDSVPRLFVVLKPLKVTLINVPEDYLVEVEKNVHPKIPSLGSTKVPFTRILYIDEDDFRTQDSSDFFRLAPGKSVGLFQAPHPITCISYETDPSTGKVTELTCRLENAGGVGKPKAFIQWVAEHAPSGSPVRVEETRIFNPLFLSDNPATVKPDFRADINPDSEEIVKGAMVEIGFYTIAKRLMVEAKKQSAARTTEALKNTALISPTDNESPTPSADQLIGNECVRFQGLRVGYFALDSDATLHCMSEPDDVEARPKDGDKIFLNRIVSLKEDAGKTK